MEIKQRDLDSAVVLEIAGRLTSGAGAAQLRQAIAGLAQAGKTKVLLNIGELVFMDSSGLGSLAAGADLLRRRGGQLRVVQARGPVKRVFQITGLYKVFPDYPDEESALASFRQ